MHSSNKLLNIHFADDTSGLCKGKNFDELVSFVNTELQKIGVRGLALKWFKSYLSNRKQFVMVNGTLSDFFP